MAQQPIVYDISKDIVDQLVGLAPGTQTFDVRHKRDKVAAATQGSYDALFDPALPGLSLAERLLVALYAARLTPSPALAAHYRQRLVEAGASAAEAAVSATLRLERGSPFPAISPSSRSRCRTPAPRRPRG